ncbi:hypothetical protein [Kitasatospora sp. NPDC093806]|uniref:hypothetical protein n=1 Tax=Kitasatospora sp. NPDC093806 TaxID=3155075 RepID=UPI0034171C1E
MKNLVAAFAAATVAGSLLLAGAGPALAASPRPAEAAPEVTEMSGVTAWQEKSETAVLVDPRQERNAVNCRFDRNQQDRERFCKALETKPMTEAAKNCLVRMGVGGAAALVAGKINKKVAREITVNTVAAGASGCLTALLT